MFIIQDAKGFVTASRPNHSSLTAIAARLDLTFPLRVFHWRPVRDSIGPIQNWHLQETFDVK